jgi:predicted dehydrogenase
MHFEPAIKALERGYNILLEKPMANNPEECLALRELAQKSS